MTDVTRESLAAALHKTGVGCEWNPVGRATHDGDHSKDADAILAALPSPAPEPPPRSNFIEWTRQSLLDAGFTVPIHEGETRRKVEKLAQRIETAVEQERAAQPAPDLDVDKLTAVIKMHRHLPDKDFAEHLARESASFLQARESGGEP